MRKLDLTEHRQLFAEIVAEVAPEELELVDQVFSNEPESSDKMADQPLGFGIELVTALVSPYIKQALVAVAKSGLEKFGEKAGEHVAAMTFPEGKTKVAFDAQALDEIRSKLEFCYAEAGLSGEQLLKVVDGTTRVFLRNPRLVQKLVATD
jgi:hypothetical protein